MTVRTHRDFDKAFARLPEEYQLKTMSSVEKFMKNPRDPALGVHKLHGRLLGRSAFSVTSSIRVVFRYLDRAVVLLLDVGGHDQVY